LVYALEEYFEVSALALSVALFIYWWLIGYPLLAVLHTQRRLLQNMLLAPVVGLAVLVICMLWLNRFLSWPVSEFGTGLGIVLVIASLGFLGYYRPLIPFQRFLPFALILLFALILTGWPLFEFGFDWLSFSNDDMANYTLEAQRLLEHGSSDLPDFNKYLIGSDLSEVYWFVSLGARPGSDLMLAWVAHITGLSTHRVFMPIMMALHLTLISVTMAMLYSGRRFYRASLITGLLLAMSALTTLGTLYQLIAQVGGLALLAANLTLTLRSFIRMSVPGAIRHGLLTGIVGAGFMVVYPELVPFFGLSFGLYLLVSSLTLIRRRCSSELSNSAPERRGFLHSLVMPDLWPASRPFWVVFGTAAIAMTLILNIYLLQGISFLLDQVSGQITRRDSDVIAPLFPYYLVPSGPAYLWGIQGIGSGFPPEPWLSIKIVLGFCLTLVALVAIGWLCWHRQPIAFSAAVMAMLGFYLFIQNGDFGLYKLAMYIQPFLWGVVALAWFRLAHRVWWQMGPLIVLVLLGIQTQTDYVFRSRGILPRLGSAFIEVPFASSSHINTEFQTLLAQINKSYLVLDTVSRVIAKFQVAYLHDEKVKATFPSTEIIRFNPPKKKLQAYILPNFATITQTYSKTWAMKFQTGWFNLFPRTGQEIFNSFQMDIYGQPPQTSPHETGLVMSTPLLRVFNRRHLSQYQAQNYIARPWNEVTNHLIFINSELGRHYYSPGFDDIALYQLEHDFWYPDQTMASVGRHFLFQVVNPTKPVRFVINITTSLKGDGENLLPSPEAIGVERLPFPIVGRGSARIFSPSITPEMLNHRAFIAIDMGVEPQRFPDHRTGLMRLYGLNIPLDPRKTVGFLRDISVISEEEYLRLAPPGFVADFPGSLAHPDLEYAGIYEDGWVSEAAFLRLSQPNTATNLSVQGMVPLVDDSNFTSELSLLVDDKEVAKQRLSVGKFEVQAAIPAGEGHRKIDLRFSNWQILPAPDNRPVAALVHFVGFETSQAVADNVSAGIGFGQGWYQPETFNGETFRWVNNDAELIITPNGDAMPELAAEVEPGPSLGSSSFTLLVYNEAGTKVLQIPIAGRQEITIKLPPLTPGKPHRFRLYTDSQNLPVPHEPRLLNFRVFQLGWKNSF
jgi:hypothetical protein